VDHRSRDEDLASALANRWPTQGWSRVLDLGAGTGSNLRYLAPKLTGRQTWTLVDNDTELLTRVDGRPFEGIKAHRAVGDLSMIGLRLIHAAHLVTASALLDLVSDAWLRALVQDCRSARCDVFFALTYDGRIDWSPAADPDDSLVRDAVNAHQRRDKGLGPALGPTAPEVAERLFREAGYEVRVAPSPWRLGPDDAELLLALIDGWAVAAEEERPSEAPRIRDWAVRRRADVRGRRAHVEVGHRDLLAFPSDQRRLS
jgi:SAM-dependent methyltransferase